MSDMWRHAYSCDVFAQSVASCLLATSHDVCISYLHEDCLRECQKRHWRSHKSSCQKRAREIKDEALFRETPPKNECPICMMRLEWEPEKATFQLCCGKSISIGCMESITAAALDHLRAGNSFETSIELTNCPLCRTPGHESDEVGIRMLNKFLEANPNNPDAIHFLAYQLLTGGMGLPRDVDRANKLFKKAGGEHGHTEALNCLGNSYRLGRGVPMDEKKSVHYYELAAMSGDPKARFNLGVTEEMEGDEERAATHCVLSAKGGFEKATGRLKGLFQQGAVTKEEYAQALYGYKKYLDEVTSDQWKTASEVVY